jgi:hypothetical protein
VYFAPELRGCAKDVDLPEQDLSQSLESTDTVDQASRRACDFFWTKYHDTSLAQLNRNLDCRFIALEGIGSGRVRKFWASRPGGES